MSTVDGLRRARRERRQRRLAETVLRETSIELEATVAMSTVAGAGAGAIAGPPGVLIGGIIGAAAGVLAGRALRADRRERAAHDAELDAAIGVTAGDLGAAKEEQTSSRGCFSAASLGFGSTSSGEDSDGPIQSVDD